MFTYEQLAPTVRQLSPVRLRNLTKRLEWETTQPLDVASGDALLLWLVQALDNVLAPDQVELLLNHCLCHIVDYGNELQEDIDAQQLKLKVAYLTIADGRYLGLSGLDCFIDLQTGDIPDTLKRVPVQVVSYNMCELYTRQVALLKRPKPGDTEATHASATDRTQALLG